LSVVGASGCGKLSLLRSLVVLDRLQDHQLRGCVRRQTHTHLYRFDTAWSSPHGTPHTASLQLSALPTTPLLASVKAAAAVEQEEVAALAARVQSDVSTMQLVQASLGSSVVPPEQRERTLRASTSCLPTATTPVVASTVAPAIAAKLPTVPAMNVSALLAMAPTQI
jgi:hypothetical protein